MKIQINLPTAKAFVLYKFYGYYGKGCTLNDIVCNYLTVHKGGKNISTFSDWYLYWCCRRYWKEVTTPKKFRNNRANATSDKCNTHI